MIEECARSHDVIIRCLFQYIVKRSNLLQQGEKLILEHAHQRHIIEVQYDGEVGTGLGPTHEFYTLVGNELQRSTLRLWRDDGRPADTGTNCPNYFTTNFLCFKSQCPREVSRTARKNLMKIMKSLK